MRLEYLPPALAEVREAAEYYAAERVELALRFLDSVSRALDRIVLSPFAFQKVFGDIRRCTTRVFPYAILFSIERECILVVAVAHLSRKPEYWRRRD